MLFDFRPKVHPQLIDNYYTPGAKLDGRCLYPFLHARVSFSGKVYFCPFIRVEVGDLAESSLEEIWNGERYVELRAKPKLVTDVLSDGAAKARAIAQRTMTEVYDAMGLTSAAQAKVTG